jgi:cephalosporin-C deacetylase-like acetyl esterase
MKVSDSKVYYMTEESYDDINNYISVLDLNSLVHAFSSDNETEYLSHGMSVVKNKFGGGKKIVTGDSKSGIEFMPVSCYVMCRMDRVWNELEDQSADTIRRYWRRYRLACKLREASYIYRLTCNFMNL